MKFIGLYFEEVIGRLEKKKLKKKEDNVWWVLLCLVFFYKQVKLEKRSIQKVN